jgi:lipopolysaccharide/colanic/teichoic acid biosynthesis glycosyltransferase
MYVDAEKHGPQLSSENDPRITPWGKIIRSTRLDEFPQFWNVLKGDMSLVGPRPERRYFAKKIMERDPSYRKLSQLKPGLTSLGQVAFGYAESVDEMCARLKYDLLYLKNMSFNTDMRIIFQTVKVMVQKKGK